MDTAEKGEIVRKTFVNSELETYKGEVRERWGNTDAYKEYGEKTKSYSKDKWSSLTAGLYDIFGEFALCREKGFAPEAEEARDLVRKLQEYISENYYTCSDEILSGLGQMYVADERFKNNIDGHGAGTASYVSEAIACYGKKQ